MFSNSDLEEIAVDDYNGEYTTYLFIKNNCLENIILSCDFYKMKEEKSSLLGIFYR
jgi:hypothetical protein